MSIFAFDFDGVICDSSYETGLRAWEVLCKLKFGLNQIPSPAIMAHWAELRPILEKGWHSVILMNEAAFGQRSLGEIKENWNEIQENFLTKHRMTEEDLHRLHSGQRDWWIKHHPKVWLSDHKFYPNILNKIRQLQQKHHIMIITTKAARFTLELLQYAELKIPKEDIIAFESQCPKEQSLLKLLQHPDAQDGLSFIEDRLPTLQRILKIEQLNSVQLYLAAWGYNTEAEREQARMTRIKVVNIEDL